MIDDKSTHIVVHMALYHVLYRSFMAAVLMSSLLFLWRHWLEEWIITVCLWIVCVLGSPDTSLADIARIGGFWGKVLLAGITLQASAQHGKPLAAAASSADPG